ncbi:MAG: hypothetical protein ACK5TG_18715 [Planctomyces sp.]|jgi:hypothetical protein|nr:hypothetical protein [Planctomycetaceae bacterium]HBC59651.1 hypothetical protein [Planctomycetaceae bacterium]
MSSSPNPLSGLKLLRMIRTSSRFGVGAGALLIGVALFLLFRGFGLGPGGGTGTGDPGTVATAAKASDAIPTSVPANDSVVAPPADSGNARSLTAADSRSPGDLTADERRAISSGILTVLIDERKFLIQIADTPAPVYRSTILNRIPELVGRCSGDSNGIRLIIRRRETARPSAEADLRRELEKLQISGDAILMPEEILP